jgi:hypothetical protein
MRPGETLRLRASGLRNLVGKSAPLGPRAINVPKPAPRDTASKPPPDSARRPPRPPQLR